MIIEKPARRIVVLLLFLLAQKPHLNQKYAPRASGAEMEKSCPTGLEFQGRKEREADFSHNFMLVAASGYEC